MIVELGSKGRSRRCTERVTAPVLRVALCGGVCRNLGSLTALCPFISLTTISWGGGVGGCGGNKLMLLGSQQAMGIKTHIVPF